MHFDIKNRNRLAEDITEDPTGSLFRSARAPAGRELFILDVQFHVSRKLALMTV
jgi:hypothetical protein